MPTLHAIRYTCPTRRPPGLRSRPAHPLISRVDGPGSVGSNCGVQPDRRSDTISFGSRQVSTKTRWLIVVVMLAIALAWAITVTMHYRADVTSLRRELRAARLPAPATVASPIILSVSTAALPASGTLRGSIMAITAISARSLKTVLVTAQIVGARPNSRYELLGGDCVGSATTRTWASGVTNADGSAQLAGPSMTISSSRHEYYFSLDLRGRLSSPGPAAHGYFGQPHGLSSVRPDVAPCAP